MLEVNIGGEQKYQNKGRITISTTDLQPRVARLTRDIETIAIALKQQQSGLTSLQQRLDQLQQTGAPGGDALTLEQRQRALAQVVEVLLVQLQDLQQRASQVAEAADQLATYMTSGDSEALAPAGQRLQKLESDLEHLRSFAAERDTALQAAVDGLRSGLQATVERLRQLADAQENLELQTALLSREAAETDAWSPEQGLPSEIPADAAGLADRLPELQQRVSRVLEQARQLSELGENLDQRTQSLEQQLASLDAGQSADRGRLDEMVVRADALESAVSRHTQQAEALSSQLAAVTDELRSLAERGAARGIEDLRQSLQQEFAHIGEVMQAVSSLDQRLVAVIGSNQALEKRIDGLGEVGDRVDQEIARLEREIRAQGPGGASHGPAVDVAELRKATDGLSVQQARQDNETRELRRRLKRRSTLGLVVLLSIAGLIAYLLLSRPQPSPGLEQLAKSASSTAMENRSGIAGLEQELRELRSELADLDSALSRVSRSVDTLMASPAPALAEQVQALASRVDGLAQANTRQAQALGELQSDQARLRTDVDAIAKAMGAEPSPTSESPPVPETGGPRERSQVDAVRPPRADARPASTAAKVAVAVQQAADAGSPVAAAAVGANRWQQARTAGRYTLQLVGVREPRHMAWFLRQHRLPADKAIHHTRRDGQPWLVLLYGIYDSPGQALAAARDLPPALAAQRPWVRRIPTAGHLEPR